MFNLFGMSFISLQLSEFCQCQPKNVSFTRGSIVVRVTLEYDLDYSSDMVIKILSKAQVQGDLLPGKDTYDVELILPNGGMFMSTI